ncbi:tryparedoxin-like [Pomacea canaliculata]|uniref:tryparedoxin-like n=1 Tax=Pomacea canaliculata TaxID=400727 RepID=UPI000D7265AA|nr:tryparedoxin-like [Pomacea canaliculata]
MSGIKEILGETVLGKNGPVDVDSFAEEGYVVGLYFSAHWCPPCRSFTPKLVECYKACREAGKKFEVVFLSLDRDQKSFDEYYGEMPWLTVGFGSDVKTSLSQKYSVCSIPTLILVDGATGETISTDGRNKVASDPSGSNFPWSGIPDSHWRCHVL